MSAKRRITNFAVKWAKGGVPVLVMLCQFVGNVFQVVVAPLAVRRVTGVPPKLDTLWNVAAFALHGAIAAPTVASALAAYLFVLSGWVTDFWQTRQQRFLTNGVPNLTIAPLIQLTVTGGIATMRARTRRTCPAIQRWRPGADPQRRRARIRCRRGAADGRPGADQPRRAGAPGRGAPGDPHTAAARHRAASPGAAGRKR